MKILILHNSYRQQGGEDATAAAEADLLRANGLEVIRFQVDNDAPAEGRPAGILRLGLAAPWSRESHMRMLKVCEEHRPDVVHVHNFWMRLSPSVHAACRVSGAATVQSLHNFRLMCANALFLRNGEPCEDCLGKVPWRGVVRRCYRRSLLASTAVAGMIVHNRRRGTWERDVDAFIALSEFPRSKFVAGGFPADRTFIKPNFVEDPGPVSSPPSASDLVVYAGRLAEEKGVSTLLSAWAGAGLGRYGRLLLLGDGPARQALERQAVSLGLQSPKVVFAGRKSRSETLTVIAAARVVVLPSICFENFPLTLAEAFSFGRPAIVSHRGSLSEIVHHGCEGLDFSAGNEADLASALERTLREDDLVNRLGENARTSYLARYTPERNYETLMRIYHFAIARRRGAR